MRVMSEERRDRTGKGTRGRPFQVSGFGLVYDGYGGDGRVEVRPGE